MSQPSRLPALRALTADSAGWGFFLCSSKDVRQGRAGDFVSLVLQDATGRIAAKIFDDVEHLRGEFETGDFVKVQGRANLYQGKLQLIVERVRRVVPDQDRGAGFSEEDCIPSAARPVAEMWAELGQRVAAIGDPFVRALVERIVCEQEERLRVWPAAQTIHHAYRGGFLEHVLSIASVAEMLARHYDANVDLVAAGAILHDIGKLQELAYDRAASYSLEGQLVGHITLGVLMVRDAARAIPGFPDEVLTHVEHLIVSHHGCEEFGSPVVPKTVEAFILAAADDLDAKINQVRQAIQEDVGDGEFTAWHGRLGRVIYKG